VLQDCPLFCFCREPKSDGEVCVIGQLFLMQPHLSFSSLSEQVAPALL
jgi:hypothetical protein